MSRRRVKISHHNLWIQRDIWYFLWSVYKIFMIKSVFLPFHLYLAASLLNVSLILRSIRSVSCLKVFIACVPPDRWWVRLSVLELLREVVKCLFISLNTSQNPIKLCTRELMCLWDFENWKIGRRKKHKHEEIFELNYHPLCAH